MKNAKALVFAMALAMLCAACANKAKPPPQSFPVSKFIWGGVGHPINVVEIDPKKFGGGYDNWNVRSNFSVLPLALQHERTIRVISSNIAGYMDQPLCQPFPTIHVTFDSQRWGRVLYENLFGQRTILLKQIQALVEANCSPGQVKAVNVATFVPTPIWTYENVRYLDRYDAKLEGVAAARYVYYGVVTPADGYALVHHDANGLARYMRTNSHYEGQLARMAQREQAERRLQQEGVGVIFADYCAANPLACAGLVTTILQSGGGSSTTTSRPGSNEFMSCMTACRFRVQSEQAFCQAGCYEFVAR